MTAHYRIEITTKAEGGRVTTVHHESVRLAAVMLAHQEAQLEETVRVVVFELTPAWRQILLYVLEPD